MGYIYNIYLYLYYPLCPFMSSLNLTLLSRRRRRLTRPRCWCSGRPKTWQGRRRPRRIEKFFIFTNFTLYWTSVRSYVKRAALKNKKNQEKRILFAPLIKGLSIKILRLQLKEIRFFERKKDFFHTRLSNSS